MNKYLFYRVTSKTNEKPRVAGFTKFRCLENLLKTFSGFRVVCLADNCDLEALALLRAKNFYRLIETSLGNAGSFRYLLVEELSLVDDEDLIYFVEDDYIHTSDAPKLLEEGLREFDYVTLYDHPDKYGNFGRRRNPFVPCGQLSEHCQLIRLENQIWRTTNSTTMTFASYARTIRRDQKVWLYFSSDTLAPKDFHAWITLTKQNPFALKEWRLKWFVISLAAHVKRLGVCPRKLGLPLRSAAAHLEKDMLPPGAEEIFTTLEG